MKQEHRDFLFKFTSDKECSFAPEGEVASILNELLSEITKKELIAYSDSLKNRFLSGFQFFDCAEMVVEENKERFLEFTWVMFESGADPKKTDGFHPWKGQFDPLAGNQNSNCRDSAWFREGVIRYELSVGLHAMGYTYSYGWWNNFSHFLNELFEFQTKEFIVSFLEQLGKKLDKAEPPSLHMRAEKRQIAETFKSWASDDLKLFDTEIDWD